MKKIIGLIAVVMSAVYALMGQTARNIPSDVVSRGVDLDEIRRVTQDAGSEMYYKKLMSRFERHDTVMTTEEYRNLYLGTMYREDYNPYRRSVYEKKIVPLAHKEHHTTAELDTMIKYTQLVLQDTPFDLNHINYLIFAYRARRKVNLANVWQYRLNHLLEAIMTTGTGQDEAGAYYVIYPRDEAAIVNLRVRDIKELSPVFVEPYYDRIDVTQDNGTKRSFFFNIKPVLEEFNRKNP